MVKRLIKSKFFKLMLEPLENRTVPVAGVLFVPANPATIPTGLNPDWIDTGDVNDDGRLDVVVANFSSSNVSVFLGNGDGTYQSPLTFPVSANPSSLLVTDLNDDCKLDIVTSSFSANNICALLNTGLNGASTVSFSAPILSAAGNGIKAIAPYDSNGDGSTDLVIANSGSNNISLIISNKNGTFGNERTFAVGTAPVALAVGDINNDGTADVVVANSGSNNISVLVRNEDPGCIFERQAIYDVGTNPSSLALGDVNRDSFLDVVVTNRDSNNVSLLLGNGNGTFKAQSTLSVGISPTSVAIGDLNGDAFLDFVVANSGSDNISIFLGNGNGTFASQINYKSQFGPAFVKLANVNGPNAFMADILIADLTSNDVRILLNSEPTASNISFITIASGASSGAAFTIQPVLSVLDAFGNSIPGYTAPVTMTVSAGATIVGTVTVNAVAGVATFANVGISGLAGTPYTLTFSSGSLAPATQVIIPTVGAPTQLTLSVNAAGGLTRSGFSAQPGSVITFTDYWFPGSTNGESFPTQPVVLIKDSGGNTITTSNALVTLTASSGATLNGNTVVSAIAGKATFTNVGVNGLAGTQYTLTYSSPGLASVTQTIGNGINGTGSGGIGGPNSRINSSTVFAVGPGSSPNSYSTPNFKVYNSASTSPSTPIASINAYSSQFTGGVVTAMGDINHDGYIDLIVGAGEGGGPHIKVYSGTDFSTLLYNFFAFETNFSGGVTVASADINGDYYDDIIVGAGVGGGPRVIAFSGQNLNVLQDFFAFESDFTGGTHIATGLINSDGIYDIVVGAGAGGGPRVKTFDGSNLNVINDFFAFETSFTGGVYVSAGNFGGGTMDRIVVGAGSGGAPFVRLFDQNGAMLQNFLAYASTFTGGVRVATGLTSSTASSADIITGPGIGATPNLRSYNSQGQLTQLDFLAFNQAFSGGIFVGGRGF